MMNPRKFHFYQEMGWRESIYSYRDERTPCKGTAVEPGLDRWTE